MTIPKPKHLSRDYADQFGDAAVVAAYHHRPAYPTQVFPALRDLVVGTPRFVLDLGCGTGDVARPLAAVVDAVDAIDCSPRMLAREVPSPGKPRLVACERPPRNPACNAAWALRLQTGCVTLRPL